MLVRRLKEDWAKKLVSEWLGTKLRNLGLVNRLKEVFDKKLVEGS